MTKPVLIQAEADVLEGGELRSVHASMPDLGVIKGSNQKTFKQHAIDALKAHGVSGQAFISFGQGPYRRLVIG